MGGAVQEELHHPPTHTSLIVAFVPTPAYLDHCVRHLVIGGLISAGRFGLKSYSQWSGMLIL